jgi:hypothetical protein
MEEEWIHSKKLILESANEVIQTQNTSIRNKSWDGLCKQIITQKNKASLESKEAATPTHNITSKNLMHRTRVSFI